MRSIKMAKKEQDLLINISRAVDKVNKLKDAFVTVTDVRLTPDLNFAKVYVSFANFENSNLEKLRSAKGFIKTEIAQVLQWRKIPDLIFEIDEVAHSADRIDQILNEIKKQK